uniref:Uncharacterized protein n=1 Tax=Arundo donax TaxID=35708 RepID=A0A0A9U7D6_ARUDO
MVVQRRGSSSGQLLPMLVSLSATATTVGFMDLPHLRNLASSPLPPSLCKNSTQLTASVSYGCSSRPMARLTASCVVQGRRSRWKRKGRLMELAKAVAGAEEHVAVGAGAGDADLRAPAG